MRVERGAHVRSGGHLGCRRGWHLAARTRGAQWMCLPLALSAGQSARLWSLDISCLVAVAGAAAPAHRGASKSTTIPAQPSGLGTRTADAKALKARSIGLAIEAWVNGLLAVCGTDILRSTISEIGPRRWRLGLFL